MCLNPVFIDNPYRGLSNVGLNYLHDCKSFKLQVPCGHCPACVSLKQNYFVQRCQCETFDNYLFFATLTYKTSMLRFVEINGYKHFYADFKDVQNMFKRIRNDSLFPRSFRYWCVSEYGSSDSGTHRPHFHMLLSIPKYDNDDKWTPYNLEKQIHDIIISQWKRNIGSKRKPIYKDLCKYIVSPKGRTFDLHYIRNEASSNGNADVAFYVSKYLLKYSAYVEKLHSALKLNLEPEEFKKVWSLLSPRCCCSHYWGNPHSTKVKLHIRRGIDFAVQDSDLLYPVFISPIDGKTFPLSPYYKKIFLTLSDAHSFYFKIPDEQCDIISHADALGDSQKIDNIYLKHLNILVNLSDREESEFKI